MQLSNICNNTETGKEAGFRVIHIVRRIVEMMINCWDYILYEIGPLLFHCRDGWMILSDKNTVLCRDGKINGCIFIIICLFDSSMFISPFNAILDHDNAGLSLLLKVLVQE